MPEMLTRDDAGAAVHRLRAFAQPLRLMILTALLDGELSVGAIGTKTAIGQPALSQQLAELRRLRVVAYRRDAKSVVYRLADARIETIVRFLALAFATVQPLDGMTASNSRIRAQRPAASAAVFAVIETE